MNDIQQYLVEEELEHLRDGWISRREFLHRAMLLGVGASIATGMASSIVPAARVRAAPLAQQSPISVSANDPAVSAQFTSYTSTDGVTLQAYQAWPSGAAANGSLPGVVICHANAGLSAHIQDVARRFAKQGYVAYAPDLPSRLGTPTATSDPSTITAAFGQLDNTQNAMDFVAALGVLSAHPMVDSGKLAATGFCLGGSIIWRMTQHAPNLMAAAPFYGSNPPLDEVSNINAAVLGIYAGLDDRTNAGMADFRNALNQAGTTYQQNVYGNSLHAFYDDTGQAYNPVTALHAWRDMLTWFADHLGLASPSL